MKNVSNNCINDKINKALKGIGLLHKLGTLLPQQSLLTIYKSLIRPHLDYGDVIYDQPLNESLFLQQNRICPIQGSISNHWSHTRIISRKIWFTAFESKAVDEAIVLVL